MLLSWDMIEVIATYWPAANGFSRTCKRMSAPDPSVYTRVAISSFRTVRALPSGVLHGDCTMLGTTLTYNLGSIVLACHGNKVLVVRHNVSFEARADRIIVRIFAERREVLQVPIDKGFPHPTVDMCGLNSRRVNSHGIKFATKRLKVSVDTRDALASSRRKPQLISLAFPGIQGMPGVK